MNLENFEFDHVGIAVSALQEASRFYAALGVSQGASEVVASEKVRVQMFNLNNNCRVELLEPTSADSTVAKFLQKRGPGIHHICLRVSDIRATLKRLKSAGIRLIHDEPIRGAHNCEVAFVHPSSAGGVLIELSQPGGDHP